MTEFDRKIEKFAEENEICHAFIFLISNLRELFYEEDFVKIKDTCKDVGTVFPKEYKIEIKAASSIDDILDVFEKYFNWLNTRYLTLIARCANIPTAESFIEIFEKHFHCKKLTAVKDQIKESYLNPNHKENVIVKINKNGSRWTVRKLIEYCKKLERKLDVPEGMIVPINSGQTGCFMFTFAMPAHCCLHAYEVAKLNVRELRNLHIQFLHINFYPKIFAFPFSLTVDAFPEVISSGLSMHVKHTVVIMSLIYVRMCKGVVPYNKQDEVQSSDLVKYC